MLIKLGDVPPHTLWEETVDSQLDCSRTLTNAIQDILAGHIVLPAIGNHGLKYANNYQHICA